MDPINITLVLLPVFFYILLFLKSQNKYIIKGVTYFIPILLVIVMGILLGLSPYEEGQDKFNYMLEFIGINDPRESEIGWTLYCSILRALLGSNPLLFFVTSALVYSFSYLFIGHHLFEKDKIGYFIIMSFGCLGFVGCGNNTIRTGISLSFIFFGMCFSSKFWIKVLLLFFSILVHKTMILPIFAFIVSTYIKERRVVYLMWLFCLILSLVSFDIQSLFDRYSAVDERIEKYGNRMGDDDIFGRFRFDFLVYSIIPIIIGYYWLSKMNIKDFFYNNVYKTYILVNSIWLLVIRMPQCNRIAYLSWFLIPIITIYPLLRNQVRIRNAQTVLVLIIGMFLFVNVVLSFKDS